jgi:hypothetical protein
MPVDPFYEPVADSFYRSYDDPWYVGILSQGIDAARDVARGALSDYAYPDDPRYRPNVQSTVYQYPQPSPQPVPLPAPGSAPQPSGNVGIPKEWFLWGGIALAFFFIGSNKRGR